MSPPNRVQTLRVLVQLLVGASEQVIQEWETEDQLPADHSATNVPSPELFEAQRVIRGACGMCMELVEDPRVRLLEISISYAMSQALDTTVRAGVPDILAEAEPFDGISVAELSRRTGIDEQKLVRVMRVLCSGGVYEEIKPLRFTNTRYSRVFVDNPIPVSLVHSGSTFKLIVEATEHLPAALLDPKMTNSTSPLECAFQRAHGENKTLWSCIETGDELDPVMHNAREMFPLAMIGQGQMSSSALIVDYPWGSLGAATVVDVEGGVGSMCLDLAKRFPDMRFVVEDLPVSIEKARPVWDAGIPGASEKERVQLVIHDFFEEQPIKGAAVYFLRCIMHDWPDDECVAILSRLREAMGPDSRILLAEMIVHPPLGSRHLKAAPTPLPANYGRVDAVKGMHDMVMLSMFNGSERTPDQFDTIAHRAGLKLEKVWECRGPLGIAELRQL
ncbi:hypothetical protein EVJ58_g5349 [Rhodofomes roseus]|uniref:Uncharacterized protein n=1 Tax=Rhodofomes roseus TaxID=34475 RepID=A0A4Y9YEY0_9APHY|nr:hypothetical protein EVJ58_g5349 [Rhodofomes roseus]